jgi:WD repeat-containing protein mio
VACGQVSGVVQILNFQPTTGNNLEFTPRQSRPCLSLAWNQQEQNLLAMGFDKNKVDHCITVWDIRHGTAWDNSIVNLIGLSESAHSMVWNGKNLIAGMSQKVKIFDLRSSPTASTVNTRAVNGLTISNNGRYLASYYDNIVNIFDLRKFTEPLSQFQLTNNLAQISWCTNSNSTNCLLCLQKDSSRTLNIIDIHWTGVEPEDHDSAHFVKRTIAPFEVVDRKNKFQLQTKAINLENICWHPRRTNNMLVLASNTTNPNSQILIEFEVPERRIAVFDKWNKLYTPLPPEIKEISNISPPSSPTNSSSSSSWCLNSPFDDISELFQQRIHQDYGQMDFERNAKVSMDRSVATTWQILAQMANADCFIGLRTILGIDSKSDELTIAQSTVENRQFVDLSTSSHIKIYKSEERDFAQELCGWMFHKSEMNSGLQAFIEDLCKRKKFTRAAMMAVFHLRIRLACDLLGHGANEIEDEKNSFRISAIALAGFGTGSIWKTQCSAAQKQIEDPHLRAIFSFLSDDTFSGVLYEDGIALCDRMAFACMFLNDRQLSEYVKFLIQNCIANGNLHGLLLTGATIDGIQLLQAFVDRTGDVQTAALIGSKIMPSELQTDNRIQTWIAIMRNLMNMWELYEKRAAFDISISSAKPAQKTPKSIFLQCTFCGKSVSTNIQEDIRSRNQIQGNKLSASCNHCRKPLPRCSLCLLHMGTPLPTNVYNPTNIKSRPVASWFSWCQFCRHGGHLQHIQEWFKNHQECPVTCCNCNCFAIDSPLLKNRKESSEHVEGL